MTSHALRQTSCTIFGEFYLLRDKINAKFLSASNILNTCAVATNGLCSLIGNLICGIIFAAKIVHLVSLS